ncbi:F-box protein PP2-B15-like [Primulina huaijiensis]|uniref:F-box protein PP2-B15-like n=1 Tax=Primulina huaijiensis TaxID=1492673 RepID=UPI003CC77C4D
MANTRIESLPEECMAHILSFTSPRDVCRSSTVSLFFQEVADSDQTWQKFLPSDYVEIVSRSVQEMKFSSMKDLFLKLSSTPLLIDGGLKTFSVDKYTNKKCYMLSTKELSITWANNNLNWCRKPLLQSRFPESVELIMVSWLEIHGKIGTRMLSSNTIYGAYLVFQLADRAFGLGTLPSEVIVEVGGYKTQGSVYLKLGNEDQRELCVRADGWLEVELGEFYNDGNIGGCKNEVKMWLREIKGEHLKGGLLVEGIEIRPKRSNSNYM